MKSLSSRFIIIILTMIAITGLSQGTDNLMNPNLINWATTVTHSANFAGTVTDQATVSSGTIGHWAMMGADLPFTCLGTGAGGYFDWSNSTGTFTTSSGTVRCRGNLLVGPQTAKTATISGALTAQNIVSNTSIAGTNAFLSTVRTSGVAYILGDAKFTTTASFGGDVTINSSQAFTVTTADKLTVNSVIVPTEVPISVNLGNLTSHVIFVADGGWKIVSVKEIHSVVSANSGTFTLEREPTGVTVPGSGTNCLGAATTSLTSTTNTLVTPALSSTPADYTLANGEKLAIVAGGFTALCQGSVTVYLKRV